MTSSTERLAARFCLGVSTLALAAGLSGAAFGQTASSGDRASRPAQSSTVQEVIVTAEKRTENLQVVPASVSAQTGADLEQNKLEQLSDYAAYIPGFNVVSGGSPGQAAISIRGISPGIGTGAAVANYIDESPVGSSGIYARAYEFQLDLLPFDLDRLELLRGPQGTLYGANSIGGLLKYVLTTPNLSHYDAEIGADVGAIDGGRGALTTVDGRINIPIKQDEAAISISAYDKHSPGYIDDLTTGQKGTNVVDQYGGRVALLWRPSDQFSLKLNAMYQYSHSNDNSTVSYTNVSPAPQPDGVILVSPVGGTDNRLTENHGLLQPFTSKVQYYAATANWNPGPVNVISATSYSITDTAQTADDTFNFGPALPRFSGGAVTSGLVGFNLGLKLEKFTEEVRVVSPTNQPIEWTLGGFYTREAVVNTQTLYAYTPSLQPIAFFAPYLLQARSTPDYKEEAVFGDATWHVTSQFDVTGGLRYSHNYQTDSLVEGGLLVGAGLRNATKGQGDVTTWLTDARYHFTPDVMAYARVATGYAPGGPSFPSVTIPAGVYPAFLQAETLTNYEVGLKAEFWDHRALVDISAYDIDWNDIQLQGDFNGFSYETNGGRATSRGFEFESQFTPVTGLKLGLNGAYTDAYLSSLSPAASAPANPHPFLLNHQLGFVPRWTVSATADYDFDLMPGWTGHVGGGVRWVDRQWATQPQIGEPTFLEPAHTVVDLNASATKDQWTVLAYVRNLTNARVIQGAFGLFGATNQLDYSMLQPLTVGVGFKARFD